MRSQQYAFWIGLVVGLLGIGLGELGIPRTWAWGLVGLSGAMLLVVLGVAVFRRVLHGASTADRG